MSRITVGIFPGAWRRECAGLFAALEGLLDLHLPAREIGDWAELDGAVLRIHDATLIRRAMAVIPHLLIVEDQPPPGDDGFGSVRFADVLSLPPCLRGRALAQRGAFGLVPLTPRAATRATHLLGSAESGPIWIRETRGEDKSSPARVIDQVACAPGELKSTETLRDHLRGGRFFPVLPLVHFLRGVAADRTWVLPPLRAVLLVDDPNLHWPTYGYVKYEGLAAHARHAGCHVAFAMVPLDSWHAHGRVVQLFKRESAFLSLLFHGNNHSFQELAQPATERAALPILAQALRRMTGFERRTGLSVSRVMVAPHNACSDSTIRALPRLGFEALCSTEAHPSATDPPAQRKWGTCAPAILAADGLPILSRHSIATSRDDLVIRAFLGQPLIVYGHHRDFGDVSGLVREATDDVNGLGDVHWCSLQELARANFMTRREGPRLVIRPFARHLQVVSPPGVVSLAVESDEEGDAGRWYVAWREGDSGRRGPWLELCQSQAANPTPGSIVELLRPPSKSVELRDIPNPPWHPKPRLRRLAAEARDRVVPALRFSRWRA